MKYGINILSTSSNDGSVRTGAFSKAGIIIIILKLFIFCFFFLIQGNLLTTSLTAGDSYSIHLL